MNAHRPCLFAAISVLVGCGGPASKIQLATPTAEEPRAVVSFDVEYAARPGTESRDCVDYDGFEVGSGEHTVFAQTASVTFKSEFWHVESHIENQLVPESESYSDSESHTNPCGSRDRHGNCESTHETRSVTKYRTVYRYQNVVVKTRVPDGECAKSAAFSFEAGRKHKVHYVFEAPNACTVTCMRDDNVPCRTLARQEKVAPPRLDEYHAHPVHYAGIPVFVAGLAALAGGTAALVPALRYRDSITDHCDANKTCDAEGLSAASKGHDWAVISTAGLAAGAALTIGGLLMMNVGGHWTRLPLAVGINGSSLTLAGGFE